MMMMFSIVSTTPLTGVIELPALGVFLAWLMIATLMLSLGGLLSMIVASMYARPVDGNSKPTVKRIDFSTGLAHRGAA